MQSAIGRSSTPGRRNISNTESFPYYEEDPDKFLETVSSYYKLYLDADHIPFGYLLPWVAKAMPWEGEWIIDHEEKHVTPCATTTADYTGAQIQNQSMNRTLERARKESTFKVLSGWRNEVYPIYGHSLGVISIERSGTPLFGINSYGVHLTAFVNGLDGMKIWVPRRTRSKQTYGGMLDNTVAGGTSTGETPMDCVVREAAEEASFPEELVRAKAKACGTVSYFYIRDERAGGEVGLLQPECQYCYDMEIGPDVVPKPNDNEVEEFYLWTVDEVKRALAEGQFKPNCAMVLLDFFVRHGILTVENEKDYVEIVSRLHRKMPFPTA